MQAFNLADLLCLLPFVLIFLAFLLNLFRKWRQLRVTGQLDQPRGLEESTPLDYAIFGVLWVYHQVARIADRTASPARSSAPEHRESASDSPLVSLLTGALHLLVIGPSRSGKTSLVHALAMNWRQTNRVMVCDPDAAPGLWAGCEVSGAGDDFPAIDVALEQLHIEITRRREQRARGVRQFPSLRVILCEYADIARYCEKSRSIIEDCLRRGGKLGISLVLDVQDKQRKTLDLDGATHLLQNFSHICEVRKSATGNRTATVIVNDGEQTEHSYDIPLLPDIDKLIQNNMLLRVKSYPDTVEPLRIEHQSASNTVPVQYGTTSTEEAVAANTGGSGLPQDNEAVAIRKVLQVLGSKNKVAEFLGGSKTTAYKRINRALGEDIAQGHEPDPSR
jgi:GTPase SAR1 family protein